jgi:hypothetical protein
MTNLGPIKTKTEYYKRCELLQVGNTLRFWNSYDELAASDYKGTVSIRNMIKDGTTNKVRLYEIPQDDLPRILSTLKDVSELGFTEDPPNKYRTIQGEFSYVSGKPVLTYTFLKEPMYLAFKKEQLHKDGLSATILLNEYCDPSSYEWIISATEIFGDHTHVNIPIIEFTCFSINIGSIPNRNTIIWEIRNY